MSVQNHISGTLFSIIDNYRTVLIISLSTATRLGRYQLQWMVNVLRRNSEWALGCVHTMPLYASWQSQPDTEPVGVVENEQRPHRKWHSVAKCIPAINEMTLSFVHSILFECWILTKAAWGQSARPHYLLSSEMARLPLKRTDDSRVRVGKPLGTILPTGTGQWTRLHQFWQCHLALPTGIQRHSVDAPLRTWVMWRARGYVTTQAAMLNWELRHEGTQRTLDLDIQMHREQLASCFSRFTRHAYSVGRLVDPWVSVTVVKERKFLPLPAIEPLYPSPQPVTTIIISHNKRSRSWQQWILITL